MVRWVLQDPVKCVAQKNYRSILPSSTICCNAAKQRYSMKQSLKKLTDILLGWVHGTAHGTMTEAEVPPLELASFCSSPAVPAPSLQRSARTIPPTPITHVPCVAGNTGKTQGRGKSRLKPHAEFVERCVNCDGTFPSIKYDPTKKINA